MTTESLCYSFQSSGEAFHYILECGQKLLTYCQQFYEFKIAVYVSVYIKQLEIKKTESNNESYLPGSGNTQY